MDWIDASKQLPEDSGQKLLIVENVYWNKCFYAVAFYSPLSRWGSVGGTVRYWRELPPMPEGVKK